MHYTTGQLDPQGQLQNSLQRPLCYRNGYESPLPKAVLHRRLERVGTAEFRVDDNEPYRPVHYDGQTNQ
jgi:hypothetical protein